MSEAGEGSPKESSNSFDARIGECEFCYETTEAPQGSGVAIVRFRKIVYDLDWGADFEKKMNRICRNNNWMLQPIQVYDDRLTVYVDFGLHGSRETLGSLKKLLDKMKLNAEEAVSVDGFYVGDGASIGPELEDEL